MTIRDCLIPCVDGARSLVDDLGLRRHIVKVRYREWDGEPGVSSFSDSILRLVPKPLVSDPGPSKVHEAAGHYETGEREVTKISPTYTRAQLEGPLDLPENTFVSWLIDDEPYELIRLDEDNFEWRARVRRLTRARNV